MTIRMFAALGAPSGHARCSVESTTYALASNMEPQTIVVFVCQCGRRFFVRDELVAHHNLVARLLASVVAKS